MRILSADELAKAGRFHFERDRDRFIVARGELRKVLAGYLEVDPASLTFCYGARGKPSLESESLQFNLSHSGSLALLALARERQIGIDIEEIRNLDDCAELAVRFFSKRENDTLKALEEKDRGKAFFECWTLKEAYVKATGDGLSRPTESFDVSFSPVSSARLVSVEGEPHEASRWSLKALAPEPGYAAAIAVEGHDWSLKCWSGSGPI